MNNTWLLLGKGRGRQVIAVARTADVVIMMLDATKGDVQRWVCVCVCLYIGLRGHVSSNTIYIMPLISLIFLENF